MIRALIDETTIDCKDCLVIDEHWADANRRAPYPNCRLMISTSMCCALTTSSCDTHFSMASTMVSNDSDPCNRLPCHAEPKHSNTTESANGCFD